MRTAVAWIGYPKFSGPIFFDVDSADPSKNRSLASSAQNPNDDHAHGSGMDWVSKIFGVEKFWMAIPLIPLKLIASKIGPSPSDDQAHGGGIDWPSKIFGTLFWMAILRISIKKN